MSCESDKKSSSRSPVGVVLKLYTIIIVPDLPLIASNCASSEASSRNGEYFVIRVTSVECCDKSTTWVS